MTNFSKYFKLPNMGPEPMTMKELSEKSGATERQIRNFIAMKVVDAPDGKTKGARYSQRHLMQVQKILRAIEGGLSLQELAEAKRKFRAPIKKNRGKTKLPPKGDAHCIELVYYISKSIRIHVLSDITATEKHILNKLRSAGAIGLKDRFALIEETFKGLPAGWASGPLAGKRE